MLMPEKKLVYQEIPAALLEWSPGPEYCDDTYFVRNTGNETFNIQLSWTRFLTWSICTFQTTSGFPQGRSFT